MGETHHLGEVAGKKMVLEVGVDMGCRFSMTVGCAAGTGDLEVAFLSRVVRFLRLGTASPKRALALVWLRQQNGPAPGGPGLTARQFVSTTNQCLWYPLLSFGQTDIYEFAYNDDDDDDAFQVSCSTVTARDIMYYSHYVSLNT